ncbi:hypothetical protein H839_15217 [Parageobacillus genomosp. 1]|jgi:DnaJ-class molecular chaperone|uniref:YuiA family protein n=1 Tax=Parageobacillus genomosp. 1 TaxID=1295642 RepID=A0ABC9VBN0_9BACL|nr:YuiA family protein [Parageobacillus genomosp. 1]EZP75462.1 hypothetical protein H839_15217 [Parageobacillus genomosp. 1]
MKHTEQTACPYCDGHGYVQLLLGGSEICYACLGTGSKQEKQAASKN